MQLTILLAVLVVYLGTSPLVWRLSMTHAHGSFDVQIAPGHELSGSGDIAHPAEWVETLYSPITVFRGTNFAHEWMSKLYPSSVITDSDGNRFY